jgi:phage terminase large subunit GpA-like protein
MGVDVQDHSLHCNVCGFSEDLKHLYGICYEVLVGDPNDAEVWNALYELFNKSYTRIDARILRPAYIFCDSGGHKTQAVYIQSIRCKRLMPIKGMVVANSRNPDPLLGKQTKIRLNAGIKGRVTLQLLGVNAAKDQLAQMETLTIAGDKRLFFPRGNGYNVDFFKGLLSEKKIGDKWIQPKHAHNEGLDTTCYALACGQYYYLRYYSRGLDREAAPQTQEGENMPRKKKNDNAETNKNPNNANPVTDSNSDSTISGNGSASCAQDNNAATPQPTPSPNPSRFPHM